MPIFWRNMALPLSLNKPFLYLEIMAVGSPRWW
jgi:hypothetical protein